MATLFGKKKKFNNGKKRKHDEERDDDGVLLATTRLLPDDDDIDDERRLLSSHDDDVVVGAAAAAAARQDGDGDGGLNRGGEGNYGRQQSFSEKKTKTKKRTKVSIDDDGDGDNSCNNSDSPSSSVPPPPPSWASFEDLGLSEQLVATCRQLGFKKPTPVQRRVVPFLLGQDRRHLLALASTGSGKTAAFVLPIIQRLVQDPYGVYAVVLTPTRELAKQIHQQIVALGAAYNVQSALVVGGLDAVRQACELENRRPHFCVATPGRLAELLRGPKPPRLKHARYVVLDEADRLLAANSGFERDVAELLLHCGTAAKPGAANAESQDGAATATPLRRRREQCQTLLFSATMSRSLESMEEMAGAGAGRLPLTKFVIREDEDGEDGSDPKKKKTKSGADGTDDSSSSDDGDFSSSKVPKIPAGLKQEYIFMPTRVRDAYLLTTIRALMIDGGRVNNSSDVSSVFSSGGRGKSQGRKKNRQHRSGDRFVGDDAGDDEDDSRKARSAIVFVSTCERAGFVSELLSQVGVDNVALHSLLSQNRRLASLGKFKSQHVRVLVATDVASRGLDIPTVDLVINSELPRNPVNYVHRVGRTARAGRRGRAISLVAESDIGLVHAAERVSGRTLDKCIDVTDDMAIKLLGPVAKAARLTKMKLMDIGFDELVDKFRERKERDRKERQRIERALQRMKGK